MLKKGVVFFIIILLAFSLCACALIGQAVDDFSNGEDGGEQTAVPVAGKSEETDLGTDMANTTGADVEHNWPTFFQVVRTAFFYNVALSIIVLVAIALIIILVPVIKRKRTNVEIIRHKEGKIKIIKRLRLKPDTNIFMDITKYIVFATETEVRIKNSFIKKNMSPIYIRIGNHCVPARFLFLKDSDYSNTYIKIDWDSIDIDA